MTLSWQKYVSHLYFSKGSKLAVRQWQTNDADTDWRRTAILWFHIQGLISLLLWREVLNRDPLEPPAPSPGARWPLSEPLDWPTDWLTDWPTDIGYLCIYNFVIPKRSSVNLCNLLLVVNPRELSTYWHRWNIRF